MKPPEYNLGKQNMIQEGISSKADPHILKRDENRMRRKKNESGDELSNREIQRKVSSTKCIVCK